MRRSTVGAVLFGVGLLYACVGDDAQGTTPGDGEDGGGTAPEAGAAPDTGAGVDPRDAGTTQPPGDAGSDGAPADAAPTCKKTSPACLDTFVQKRKLNCDPARQECQAKPECGSSQSPCVMACKAAWLDCQDKYEKECVACDKTANVCDPTEDCHTLFFTP